MTRRVDAYSRRGRRPPAVTEIGYIHDQVIHYADARDCIDVPFEICSPVREFPSWRKKRNYSGKYWSLTTGGHIPFESLYERTALIELDRDPNNAAISSQPMWLFWPESAGGRSHAPDFFLRHTDGRGTVVDVRPRERISEKTAEIFEATRLLCEKVGFEYMVICDLDPMLDRNLSAIMHYRNDIWQLPGHLWPVVAASGPSTSPRTLATQLEPDGGGKALGWVYWLLWHGHLEADLSQPLSLDSEVTTKGTGKP